MVRGKPLRLAAPEAFALDGDGPSAFMPLFVKF